MRVTVRFVDGERLDGDAEQVTLDRGGFSLVGTQGNSRSVWVGAGAIKYIVIHPAAAETYGDIDPREGSDLQKVVLRFIDGQVLRTYRDEAFAETPGGFSMRLWDPDRCQLERALVAAGSLKGVFMVDEWDSRSGGDRRSREAVATQALPEPVEATAVVEAEAAIEAEATAQEADTAEPSPVPVPEADVAPEPGPEPAAEPEIQGPMLVEEPPLQIILATGGASEERRPSFGSGLSKRRGLAEEQLTPEQERRRLLRLRVSEVLGRFPAGEDPEA